MAKALYKYFTVMQPGVLFVCQYESVQGWSRVYRSIDYGENWTIILNDRNYGGNTGSAFRMFTPTLLGFCLMTYNDGIYFSASGNPGTFTKVTLGGDTEGSSSFSDINCFNGISSVVLSTHKRYTAGVEPTYQLIHKSGDGGETWSTVRQNQTFATVAHGKIRRGAPVLDDICIVGGTGSGFTKFLAKSLDIGATWSDLAGGVQDSPSFGWSVNKLFAGRGVTNVLYFSTDSGANWSSKNAWDNPNSYNWQYHDSNINNADEIITSSGSDFVAVSLDFGDTWNKYTVSAGISIIGLQWDLYDENVIYCIASNGDFYKSSDKGQTWNAKSLIWKGLIWIEGNDAHYGDTSYAERNFTGALTGSGLTAGKIRIAGTDYRYGDSGGNERSITGTVDNTVTLSSGIKIIGTRSYYKDNSGDKRYTEGGLF